VQEEAALNSKHFCVLARHKRLFRLLVMGGQRREEKGGWREGGGRMWKEVAWRKEDRQAQRDERGGGCFVKE
jgi:hypothetical protein